jgi:hypothetical protein
MTQSMTMVDHDHEQTLIDNLGQPVPAGVSVLQNNLMKALNKAYPKWEGSWLIRIDTRGGIVQFYNTWFTGNMGFVLHITEIDPEMRRVRKMAGELFERYDIARNRGLNIKQALVDLKRDPIGQVKYED